MRSIDILTDGLSRVQDNVHAVLDKASGDDLVFAPTPDANSIAWLIWHLTRVQDAQVADVAGTEQVWTSQGFADRFALPFDNSQTGYGQSIEQVRQVRVTDSELLAAYYDATHAATLEYLGGLTDEDLDRVVDDNWDPPVTLGVRLVSVVDDDVQHVGQAGYILGLT